MKPVEGLLASPAAARLDEFVRALARGADGFDLSPELVWMADEVAGWPAGLSVDERRALMLAVLASWVAVRQGSTRLALDVEPGSQLVEAFDALVARARTEGFAAPGGAHHARVLAELFASGRAGALVGGRGEMKPLVLDGAHLYLHRALALEERLATAVAALLPDVPADRELQAQVADVCAHPPVSKAGPEAHTPDQVRAIGQSVSPGLSVITGGPGSGKTSIVVSVLRVLARRGVEPASVALVAPTGKAAQRMGAAIESALARLPGERDVAAVRAFPAPATLHRLMGYSPTTERFRHHENNRLPHAHVIVDEASMIDLALAERLFRALRPGASLVLLGDDRQLPAVDAGQPLRDLVVAARTVPRLGRRVVALTHSHRMDAASSQGAAILAAAHKIQAGEAPEGKARGAAGLKFSGVEQVDGSELEAVVDRWFAEHFAGSKAWSLGRDTFHQTDEGFGKAESARLERLFEHLESFRVLAYTRAHPEGTEALNAAFHQRVLAAAGIEGAMEFAAGEPVIMLANDYERGVFNGDLGVVLRVSGHQMVVFRRAGGFVAFSTGALRGRIQHAFALTVHKAQGSEHDHVLLVLPGEDFPMNTRELVYTALTRARRSVTIVGSSAVLARGAERAVRRDSGVPERLLRVTMSAP